VPPKNGMTQPDKCDRTVTVPPNRQKPSDKNVQPGKSYQLSKNVGARGAQGRTGYYNADAPPRGAGGPPATLKNSNKVGKYVTKRVRDQVSSTTDLYETGTTRGKGKGPSKIYKAGESICTKCQQLMGRNEMRPQNYFNSKGPYYPMCGPKSGGAECKKPEQKPFIGLCGVRPCSPFEEWKMAQPSHSCGCAPPETPPPMMVEARTPSPKPKVVEVKKKPPPDPPKFTKPVPKQVVKPKPVVKAAPPPKKPVAKKPEPPKEVQTDDLPQKTTSIQTAQFLPEDVPPSREQSQPFIPPEPEPEPVEEFVKEIPPPEEFTAPPPPPVASKPIAPPPDEPPPPTPPASLQPCIPVPCIPVPQECKTEQIQTLSPAEMEMMMRQNVCLPPPPFDPCQYPSSPSTQGCCSPVMHCPQNYYNSPRCVTPQQGQYSNWPPRQPQTPTLSNPMDQLKSPLLPAPSPYGDSGYNTQGNQTPQPRMGQDGCLSPNMIPLPAAMMRPNHHGGHRHHDHHGGNTGGCNTQQGMPMGMQGMLPNGFIPTQNTVEIPGAGCFTITLCPTGNGNNGSYGVSGAFPQCNIQGHMDPRHNHGCKSVLSVHTGFFTDITCLELTSTMFIVFSNE